MEYIKDSIRILVVLLIYIIAWFFVLIAWAIDYCYRGLKKLILWKKRKEC